MSKEKLVPKLRFEEFINKDGWGEDSLGNMSQSYSGGTPRVGNNSFYNGDIPFIRSGEIHKDSTKLFVSEEALNNSSARMVRKGDILYALYGATSGEVSISKIDGAINQAILAIIPDQKYNNNFLEKYLNKDKEYILNSFLQGGQGNLSGKIIRSLNITHPTADEQKKIGNFFKKIDQMIQLQQSKVDKGKDIKSAYLSEMFPKEGEKYPKKRFEGFTEPWAEHNLGEVAQIKTGNTNVQDAVPDGKYTFFDRSTDIKRIDKFYYDEETIIYPGEGSEFYPRYFSGKYALHQRAYAITSDVINLEYLVNMMMLRNNHFVNNAVGSTVKSLRMENFLNCKVFVPSLKEQKKITELFKIINSRILIEEEKLDKLEKLKQAYLNNMFV